MPDVTKLPRQSTHRRVGQITHLLGLSLMSTRRVMPFRLGRCRLIAQLAVIGTVVTSSCAELAIDPPSAPSSQQPVLLSRDVTIYEHVDGKTFVTRVPSPVSLATRNGNLGASHSELVSKNPVEKAAIPAEGLLNCDGKWPTPSSLEDARMLGWPTPEPLNEAGFSFETENTAEPATCALIALGLVGLGLWRQRRRTRPQ